MYPYITAAPPRICTTIEKAERAAISQWQEDINSETGKLAYAKVVLADVKEAKEKNRLSWLNHLESYMEADTKQQAHFDIFPEVASTRAALTGTPRRAPTVGMVCWHHKIFVTEKRSDGLIHVVIQCDSHIFRWSIWITIARYRQDGSPRATMWSALLVRPAVSRWPALQVPVGRMLVWWLSAVLNSTLWSFFVHLVLEDEPNLTDVFLTIFDQILSYWMPCPTQRSQAPPARAWWTDAPARPASPARSVRGTQKAEVVGWHMLGEVCSPKLWETWTKIPGIHEIYSKGINKTRDDMTLT